MVFARGIGTVYLTYIVSAPDPFVAPYDAFLLKRTPKEVPEQFRAWRKDEHPTDSDVQGRGAVLDRELRVGVASDRGAGSASGRGDAGIVGGST